MLIGEVGHSEEGLMDNTVTPKEGGHSDSAQAERKLEAPSRSPAEASHPSPRSSSSSTATEDDYEHSPVFKGKREASQRLMPSERTQESGEYRQNAQYSKRRPDDSFSRQHPIQTAQSGPSMPQSNHRNSYTGLVDGFAHYKAQSFAQESFGQRGFGSHQLQHSTGDPRRSKLAQLSSAAKFDTAALPYGNYDNSARFPPGNNEEMVHGRYDNTGIDDHDDDSDHTESYSNRGRKRKRKSRSKGKQAERWDAMFSRLVEFKRIHGHCLVPNRYAHDPSLGAWVSTQRRHYKILTSGEEGVTSPMTPSRAARLASIGFAWQTSDPRHVPWETRFQQLLEYKAQHGDCVVPIGWKENPRLSNWVSAQRQEYKLFLQGKKCRIDEQQVNALNAVGFVWEAQRGNNKKRLAESDDVTEEVAQEAFAAFGNGNSDIVSSLGFPADNLTGGEKGNALVSQVLALLAAQQQSNGLQAAQGPSSAFAAADAARALLQQSGAPNALTTRMATNASHSLACLDVSSKPPPQPIAAPTLLMNHAMNQRERLAASALDHQTRVMAAATDPTEPIKIRRQPTSLRDEQIISKHLSYALRNEPDIDEREVETAVQRILGTIRGAGNVSPPPKNGVRPPFQSANPAQKSERLKRMSPGPRFPPVTSQEPSTDTNAEATANKSDLSESEASKFGVALQIQQVVGKPAVSETESDFRQDIIPENSTNAIHLLKDKEQEGVANISGGPTRRDGENSKDRSASPDRRRPSDLTTTSVSTAGLKGTSNMSSTRSSFSAHEEDEELFADADEEDDDEDERDETWQGSDD